MNTNEQALKRNRKERYFKKQFSLIAQTESKTLSEPAIIRFYYTNNRAHCSVWLKIGRETIVGGGNGIYNTDALKDAFKSMGLDYTKVSEGLSAMEYLRTEILKLTGEYYIVIANG